MTDPFTDEDVRKAKDAYNDVTRDILVTHTDGIKSALLAGTERLRAQGTWNEAIEAPAGCGASASRRSIAGWRRGSGVGLQARQRLVDQDPVCRPGRPPNIWIDC